MSEAAARPSSALRSYLLAVIVAGAFVLAQSLVGTWNTPQPQAWMALVALILVAGWFRLNSAVSATIGIDDTFLIATALLFGTAPATLAIASNALIFSLRRRQPPRQIFFNVASLAITMWVAGRTFFALAHVQPLALSGAPVAPLVLPLVTMAVVFFAVNSGLTAIVVGLDSWQSPIGIWRRHFRWLWVGYLGAASVAFCLVLLLQQRSLTAAAMVLPLLAVFHLTLRASFGRLDDARRHLGDLDRLYLSTVETLAMAIDAKDDVTHSHVRRVQAYAVGLARALSVTDELTLKAIEAAALLHDTGKLAVPERILNKPGKLTDVEFEKMKEHVDIGADILSLVEFPFPVVPIVRAHHESWDGSGYPRGLKGADIPIGARILSVVDCFDALTSDRPYRRKMTDADAIAILRERQGKMYDPVVVDTFVRVYRDINVVVDAPEHREVMQRVTQSRQDDCAVHDPAPEQTGSAPSSLLAFVSLSRVASGDAGVADVLALSSQLLADVVPGATGAWYIPDSSRDQLLVADSFGPASGSMRGLSVTVGDRLTGWVAANRQPIVNSDAALDLGPAAEAASLQSCMSVPLLRGESLVGVLSLYAPTPSTFAGDCGRLVQMVAPHIAVALHVALAIPDAKTAPSEKAPAAGLRLVSTR
ncbi:MAG TPA: HD domain-containing phosphohydrolase [Vicinamibacterales bacterium]|nr:HD domain-containing phosphohydrolase [Vicinamibacterales bacterium]